MLILENLKQSWIPENWSNKQINVLVEIFIEKQIDDRLLMMHEKDTVNRIQLFLKELFEQK